MLKIDSELPFTLGAMPIDGNQDHDGLEGPYRLSDRATPSREDVAHLKRAVTLFLGLAASGRLRPTLSRPA
jgi:hypothetical protein